MSLGSLLLMGVAKRRRRWQVFLGISLTFACFAAMSACGGGTSNSGGGHGGITDIGTTPGTYTVTVTGTSGTATETAPVTVTVQ